MRALTPRAGRPGVLLGSTMHVNPLGSLIDRAAPSTSFLFFGAGTALDEPSIDHRTLRPHYDHFR